jgi:phospholipase C
VSFLKPATAQTGHPADSTPLAEQQFLVQTINALQRLPEWKSMAIMITYDDSDGWYDHVMPPIVNQSNDPAQDTLLGAAGMCGTPAPGAYLDRCGYGARIPFLVISPYAKRNFVSHALNDLTSVTRFIEDNWDLGRLGDQSFDALAGVFWIFSISRRVRERRKYFWTRPPANSSRSSGAGPRPAGRRQATSRQQSSPARSLPS